MELSLDGGVGIEQVGFSLFYLPFYTSRVRRREAQPKQVREDWVGDPKGGMVPLPQT